MKMTLPSGQDIQVYVHHTDDEEVVQKHTGNLITGLRGTRVRVALPDDTILEARSVCKPPDNFCRRFGRKNATIRLLHILKDKMSSDDRGAIFHQVCHEYTE